MRVAVKIRARSSQEDEIAQAGLPLGQKLSFFTPDSEYHGGPGGGYGIRHFSGGAEADRGQSYQGYWKDDEQHGSGALQTKEGTTYDGEWEGGKFHGEGTYVFQKFGTPSASVYAGQWQEGKKHGKGKLTLYSGNCYDGQWTTDKRHGARPRAVQPWPRSHRTHAHMSSDAPPAHTFLSERARRARAGA